MVNLKFQTYFFMVNKINLNNLSQITDVPIIQRLKNFNIVFFKSSSIWWPSLMMSELLSIELCSKFNHLINFLLKSLWINSDLPQNLISIEAKYKLGFIANWIMPRNFGWNITIDLNNLKESIVSCEIVHMLVSDFALRIPAWSKVND